jgi:hypothetical protein
VHRFQGHWRGKSRLAAVRFAFSNLRQVGEFKEFSSGMTPACRLSNWARPSVWFVEFVVSAKCVSLQNA